MAKKNKNKDAGEEENKVNNNTKSNDSKTQNNTIVLKVDLHCEGCANKVVKIIRSSQGVEGVKCEWTASKISVEGDVDPLKLREEIEQRTHKKVEVISPLPKKEKNKDKPKDTKETEKDNVKESEDIKKKSKEWKKPKELPVTTAVLKVNLHCEGCIQKIHKLVSKTKGYKEMKVDKQKDLVTVTGAIEMKSLAENLKKHLKRHVEIVPEKKDDEKKDKGDKKDGGNDKKEGGGKKGEKGDGNGGGGGVEGNLMQVQPPFGFFYPPPPFNSTNPGFGDPQQFHQVQYSYGQVHAPQLFSDENPNACVVM